MGIFYQHQNSASSLLFRISEQEFFNECWRGVAQLTVRHVPTEGVVRDLYFTRFVDVKLQLSRVSATRFVPNTPQSRGSKFSIVPSSRNDFT
jgi:hypothetical protein